MLNSVVNNPYRILGVFSNATLKEITANKTKLARYASVGKSVSFDADMNGVLPPPTRTSESVEKAFADLSLAQDKLKHALFWFVKDTSFDEMALGHLNAGNVDKAVEILEKRETWSSLLNLGVLAMIHDDYDTAVGNIIQIIREYDGNEYLEKFVASICGDTFQIEDDDVAHIFIDALLEELEPMEVRRLFIDNGAIVDDDDYIQEKIIGLPINRIKSEISKVKNVDPDNATASYLAGKELMESTKRDLKMIKDVCGDGDSNYGMIADNLAKQILQCGINYYNETFDEQYERLEKAMELQNYALSIAVGPITKGRCKQNVDILLKRKMELPPKEVLPYVENVTELLNRYKTKSLSIANAIQLIRDCAPNLVSIKEKVGSLNYSYVTVSTGVVAAALAATVDEVNKAQEPDIFGNYNLQKIKDVLREAWRATLFMEKLDMEPSFKRERFDGNRDTLKKMIEDLHGFFYANLARRIVNPLNVFGKSIVVDLDMRTEVEYYKACRTKEDYNTYLKRYSNGMYVFHAKQELAKIEKAAWDKCKTMDDFKKYLNEYPNGAYQKEAREKIDQFEEEILWVDSKNDDTIESYNNYIFSTKLSKYTQEAKLAIERLKEEHRKDEAMWKGCQKKEDFEKYLQAFPRALHKAEAKEKIEKFESQKRNLIIAAVILGLGVIITLAVVFGG